MTYAGNKTSPFTLDWQHPVPDPTQLTGLVEFSEMQLESGTVGTTLRAHYEAMAEQLLQQRCVVRTFGKGSLVKNNLRDLARVESAVEDFLTVSAENDLDRCWEALEELDTAIDELRVSTEELTQLAA